MIPIIKEVTWLKVREGYKTGGLAIFPFIFVTDKTDLALIEHEKVHIRQQIEGLFVWFAIKYIFYQKS